MKSLLLVILPMLLGAFGIGAVQETALEQKHDAMPMMMQNCPMKLQGTEVTVEDTATGVALMFTNKPDKVAELQRRVERMALMHGAERPAETMMQHHMVAAAVKYEAIQKGARLTLTPKDPAQLAQLRTQVRAHVDRMKNGECPMMQGMMHGMKDRDETDHHSHQH